MSVLPSAPDSASRQSEPSAGVSAVFQELTTTAVKLNAVSDELAQPISVIDEALQKLNLGVSAWVEVVGEVDPSTGEFWDHSIGYDKISRKWGIAVRARSGNQLLERLHASEAWRFNDAPRAHRLEALDKLPELLEELVKVASNTADALKNKLAATKQVAKSIRQVASSTRTHGK